ncbi:MAG: metallophosphoesterase [Caldimonas sp.]
MPLPILSILLHGYVAWRLVPALAFLPGTILFAALLAVSALAMPLGLGARRGGTRRLGIDWAWVGLVAMGWFSSLFVLTVARDVGLLAAVALDAVRPGSLEVASIAEVSARFVAIVAVVVTLWGFGNARRTARVRRVDVPVAGLAPALDGFTIAQISDVHVGPTIKRPYVEAIVATVNGLDADLVAVTGDLVDGSVAQLAEHVAPLAGLRSKEGIYFVTGNHEYYSGAAAWVRELRRLGLVVLMNEHVAVHRGGAALVVAGVTDFSAAHFDRAQASDPRSALAGSPAGAFRLLLAHQPRSADAAEAAGFDLQLSGHTHGGQFWPWNLFVRLQQPFTAGLHRWRRLWVYTSRGTGYWGPPKRFGAPSEVTFIRLVARPAPAGSAAPTAAAIRSRVAESAPAA